MSEQPEQPSAEIARADDAEPGFEPEPDWAYETIEFMGDKLNYRKPTPQALQSLYFGSSPRVAKRRPNMPGESAAGFLDMHLSEASFDRVLWRMMNPDDPDYTEQTVADLFKIVSDSEDTPDAKG